MIFSFQRADRYSIVSDFSRCKRLTLSFQLVHEPRDATEQNKIKQIFYQLWIFI